jgi:hypothetical protein
LVLVRSFVQRALIALAALFLTWEIFAVTRWIRQAGGIGSGFRHLWVALRSDWMALIVVSDHLVIAGTVLVLLLLDAANQGWRMSRLILLVVGFIGLGSPTLLLYIAWRMKTTAPLVRQSPVA